MFKFDENSGDYDNLLEMLEQAEEHWGIDKDTMLDHMTRIAYHETGRTLDPKQKQIGGKPGQEGMGLFQYETGKGEGGHTAMNRLIDYYEPGGLENMPDFIKDRLYKDPNTGQYAKMGGKNPYYFHDDEGFDASELTPEQQYMLFLADKRGDKTASFKGVDTPEELKQFWLDEHYAGDEKKARGKSFDDTMGLYKDTLLDQIMPTEDEKKAQDDTGSIKPSENPIFDFFTKPFNPLSDG